LHSADNLATGRHSIEGNLLNQEIMMNFLSSLTVVLLFILVGACDVHTVKATGYDPAADPGPALEQAVRTAQNSSREVLLIAGGDWCPWCMALEKFIAQNADVKAALDQAFVVVEVYYGDKNKNTAFFAKLPPAKGYPHFWVIGRDGAVIRSVDTANLEDGASGYDKAKFLQFIATMAKG
jgi:hypothetical protein